MFCQNCGNQVADDQRFCANCGAQLTAPTQPVVPAQPVAPAAPVQPAAPAAQPVVVAPVATMFADPKKKKMMMFIAAGVVLALVLCAVLFMGGGTNLNSMFSDYADEYWCIIGSDGSWMEVDTNPYDEEDFLEMDAWDGMQDMLTRMGFGSGVAERMSSTRSIDGMQFEENDKFELSWTYHPDDGLEVLVEVKK